MRSKKFFYKLCNKLIDCCQSELKKFMTEDTINILTCILFESAVHLLKIGGNIELDFCEDLALTMFAIMAYLFNPFKYFATILALVVTFRRTNQMKFRSKCTVLNSVFVSVN